jgi:hypothetical protein
MHNAWNDHEGWRKSYFWMIPLIDANAPIWCLLLPYECESLAFFPIFS